MAAPVVAISTEPVMRPAWRRVRPWLALAVVVLLGALLVEMLSTKPGRPLDPDSAHKDGSKALGVLLRHAGASLARTTSLANAQEAGPGSTVLVVSPDSYSGAQLAALAHTTARIVLIEPSNDVLTALGLDVEITGVTQGSTAPGCTAPGAVAAGPIELTGSTTYAGPGAVACYDGAVLIGPQLVVIGSSELLRNDTLARAGVAALDLNTIDDNGASRRVVWLMPGSEAAGPGAPSVWQLFPAGAHRAFGWLIVLGILLVLWRGRRLGPAVTEPLPVVVRAAEVVEGHGRLYQRAGARDRAAAALRLAALARLASHVGLHRRASGNDVATAAATATGRHVADVARLLGGAVPSDDSALLQLAIDLDALESAAAVPPRRRGPNP